MPTHSAFSGPVVAGEPSGTADLHPALSPIPALPTAPESPHPFLARDRSLGCPLSEGPSGDSCWPG